MPPVRYTAALLSGPRTVVCIRQERAFADEYCWCICADVEHHAVWAGTAPPRSARLLPSQPYRARTTENTRECR